MRPEPAEFNDPGLKKAVQLLQRDIAAPPTLRGHISQRLSAQRPQQQARPSNPPSRFRFPRQLALAAALVVCIGGALVISHLRNARQARDAYSQNDALIDAMIDIQSELAAGKTVGDAVAAPMSDPAALSAAATQKLGRVVPALNLSKQGWTLASASYCDVNHLPSIQFHFTRDRASKSMTVLSMPASAWANSSDGSRYDLIDEGHPVAGYVKSGSLNCLVGDTSVSQDEAITLRDQLQGGG